jgi:hypothetical protein
VIKKLLKLSIVVFVILVFSSCAQKTQKAVKTSGFNSKQLIMALLSDLTPDIKDVISKRETILVSDFVNISNYYNRSQLGFLFSNTLKSIVTSRYKYEVKEVNLRKHFAMGSRGFNLLSRNQSALFSKIDGARYALVGTYSITDAKLILFLNIIDIYSNNVISSSMKSIPLVDTILKLEGIYSNNKPIIYQPLVL